MAGLIEAFSDTGLTLYAMVRNVAGQTWNTSLGAFQTWNPANWTDYALAMTEQASSGFYTVAVPPAITAQRLTLLVYSQLGVLPAIGDQTFGNSTGTWDGTTWSGATGIGADVNVVSINGSAPAAVQLSISAATMISGTAVAGTLTVSQMTTNLSYVTTKLLFGRVVYFTNGALIGQVAAISAYDGATKKITFFQSITSAPVVGTTFIIV